MIDGTLGREEPKAGNAELSRSHSRTSKAGSGKGRNTEVVTWEASLPA